MNSINKFQSLIIGLAILLGLLLGQFQSLADVAEYLIVLLWKGLGPVFYFYI